MSIARAPRSPLARCTLLVALSLAACSGGSDVGTVDAEPGTSGGGTGGGATGSGGKASGGTGSGGSIGGSTGGGTTANDKCSAPRDEAPGTPVYDLSQVGSGECEGVTLGATIERIHAEHPELTEIQELYAPDPERLSDGSFIYAFQKPDGTFALVFRRGDGDCESGCIENDYFYFDTVAECAISAEGTTSRRYDGACLPPEQLPKWGIPPAPPPESICGTSMAPQDLSGTYVIYLCGQGSACTTKDAPQTTLPDTVTLQIAQDATDLANGTVTLSGTGEPLIDGRALSATFERRRFKVEEHVSNLPAQCIETSDLTIDYDFEGFGPQHLSFARVSTPDCEASPGDYCKGGMEASLGSTVDTQ